MGLELHLIPTSMLLVLMHHFCYEKCVYQVHSASGYFTSAFSSLLPLCAFAQMPSLHCIETGFPTWARSSHRIDLLEQLLHRTLLSYSSGLGISHPLRINIFVFFKPSAFQHGFFLCTIYYLNTGTGWSRRFRHGQYYYRSCNRRIRCAWYGASYCPTG